MVVLRTIHPVSACPKPALESKLLKLVVYYPVCIPPQAENTNNNSQCHDNDLSVPRHSDVPLLLCVPPSFSCQNIRYKKDESLFPPFLSAPPSSFLEPKAMEAEYAVLQDSQMLMHPMHILAIVLRQRQNSSQYKFCGTILKNYM